jgi:hypothetical protein
VKLRRATRRVVTGHADMQIIDQIIELALAAHAHGRPHEVGTAGEDQILHSHSPPVRG